MDWSALAKAKTAVLEKSRSGMPPATSVPIFLLLRQTSCQSEVLVQTAELAHAMSKSKRSGSQSPARHMAALYHWLPRVEDRFVPYLSKPKAKAPAKSKRSP